MKQLIVVTGASSGLGALAARPLADAGHTVYASMRETEGRNAAQVKAAHEYATARKVDLRAIELDVASQESADPAIRKIVEQNARLDVVVHNAGHMVFGPAEAFTPEQFAELYDVNVLRRSASTARHCRSFESKAAGCWSGCRAAAWLEERRLIWNLTLPRRPACTPWPCNTHGNWRSGASNRRLLCRGLHEGNQPIRACRSA